MSSVAQILEDIEALPEDEQRQLHDALGQRLNPPQMTEEEFADMLARKGIIRRSDRSKATPPDQRVKPVPIKGEPLSETVIKERR